jgi:hypothetical protein
MVSSDGSTANNKFSPCSVAWITLWPAEPVPQVQILAGAPNYNSSVSAFPIRPTAIST